MKKSISIEEVLQALVVARKYVPKDVGDLLLALVGYGWSNLDVFWLLHGVNDRVVGIADFER